MSAVSDVHPTSVRRHPRPSTQGQGPRRLDRDPSAAGEVLATRVGLQIPSGLNFEGWERAGRQLAGVVDSSAWWLGDWLVYGKDNYADRYQRSIRAAGLKYQTLRNYAWVSRRFELNRRRARLSFQHHAEVASLPLNEQEWWLDRAEQMKWSTKQLRDAIQHARDTSSGGAERAAAIRRLALPGNRLQWWYKAAERSGVEFEKWVLATLDSAAKNVLEDLGDLVDVLEDRVESHGLSLRAGTPQADPS